MPKKVGAIAIKSFALLALLGTAYLGTANQAMAQDAATPYPNTVPTEMVPAKMALIDQYLIADQGAEIALARSAAPSPFHAMQRYRFLDVMVSKRRSKAKTVSCVSWDARGHPQRMLTFGIRKCGFPCV
jgi:hypothetical protein